MLRRRAALPVLAAPFLGAATQRPDPRLPPAPAALPPAPPALPAGPAAPPAPPPTPALPPLSLPPTLRALPNGGWRLSLTPASPASLPDEATRAALAEIGRRLAQATAGRVTLVSQVSTGEDTSTARRLSLDRAVAARAALVAGGLPETRLDVVPLGRTPAGLDALDILPPGVARP